MGRTKGSKNKKLTNAIPSQPRSVTEIVLPLTQPDDISLFKDYFYLNGEHLRQIINFCERKGITPSELIEKYEQLEVRVKYLAESKVELEQEYGALMEKIQTQTEPTPDSLTDSKKAELQEKQPMIRPESKPIELSPFMKQRQSNKNGIK